MPSILTHYFFSKDVSNNLEEELNFLSDNQDFISLGAQGPDPLFFMGLIPGNGLHPLHVKEKYGTQIHKSDGKKFFKTLFEEADRISDINIKNKFKSFIYGQFTHYILDATVHPFIYYFSGFDELGNLTGKYHYSHAHFEARIDSSLTELRGEKDEILTSPQKAIFCKEDDLKLLDEHFNVVLKNYFSRELPKDFYKSSVKNMDWCYRFTNDISKFKLRLLGKGRLGALNIPFKTSNNVLNLDHKAWQNPITGESSVLSFVELINLAKEKMKKANQVFMKKGFEYLTMSAYLSGVNYSGFSLTGEMKYKDISGDLLLEDLAD